MAAVLLRLLLRRIVHTLVLVFVASSVALLLVHLAAADVEGFGIDPRIRAVERARLGLDRPFLVQYSDWMRRAWRLDFGESVRYRRPVASLLRERVGNTVILGAAALLLALATGLPAGVLTGATPRRLPSRLIRAASLVLVSVPPLVTSLLLLMLAVRSGWVAAGGFDRPLDSGIFGGILATMKSLPLPALALALPIAASLERLQSRAIADALHEPSIIAARSRGLSSARATWVHAWRLSLTPILGVLGIVIGTVLSGSFVVEFVMSWPGLGELMYQALTARDMYLAAGCAAVGAMFLALGLAGAELALQLADPRVRERT